jgi:hypothetical protein
METTRQRLYPKIGSRVRGILSIRSQKHYPVGIVTDIKECEDEDRGCDLCQDGRMCNQYKQVRVGGEWWCLHYFYHDYATGKVEEWRLTVDESPRDEEV